MRAWAQDVSIQGRLDRTEIKPGEQAAIDLIIRTDDLPHTKFYLKEDVRKSDAYTVIAFGALDTVDVDQRLKEITARLVITSFDSTLVTIPPIVVETPTGQAETNPMALNVVQPEVDAAHPENIKDIKAPWEVGLTWRDGLEQTFTSWIFWCILIVIIAAYSIYRFLLLPRKENPAPVAVEPERVYSLAERIEQDFVALEVRRLWLSGQYKEHYTELVAILKHYLDERRAWSTAEMTTSELSDKVRAEQLPEEQIVELEHILREADLSKFAKWIPAEASVQHTLRQARHLVDLWEREEMEQESNSSK